MPQTTVYAIQPGRGFEQAAGVLGEDFAGFLVRDGWAVYRRFGQAVHQTCLAHLLRRCQEMIVLAPPGGTAARFPRAVQEILQQALDLCAHDRPPPRMLAARRQVRNLTVHVGPARRLFAGR